MPLSLRISPDKERLIEKASKRTGKTKSAFIIEAIEEKLGITRNREKLIRELAGWMSHEEAEELREAVDCFN